MIMPTLSGTVGGAVKFVTIAAEDTITAQEAVDMAAGTALVAAGAKHFRDMQVVKKVAPNAVPRIREQLLFGYL